MVQAETPECSEGYEEHNRSRARHRCRQPTTPLHWSADARSHPTHCLPFGPPGARILLGVDESVSLQLHRRQGNELIGVLVKPLIDDTEQLLTAQSADFALIVGSKVVSVRHAIAFISVL